MSERGPAAAPCRSCPYRRDVPSGVWHESEYDKLPAFDRETGGQPFGAFFCHQQDGRLCAGWCGTHDMQESLGLRLAYSHGLLTDADMAAAIDYVSPVPLWGSGAEAAAHGKAEVDRPREPARRVIDRIERKRQAKEPR